MNNSFITGVVLTEVERQIIKEEAEKRGLGARGFSTSLRIIVREWKQFNEEYCARRLSQVQAPQQQQPEADR